MGPGTAVYSRFQRNNGVLSYAVDPNKEESRPQTPSTGQEEPIDISLFETAGTPEDKGAWESLTAPVTSLFDRIDFSEPSTFDGEEKSEYDPLRDGPLRYLGYANELGEAFAAWLFPGGVPLSYAIAISYVLFDTWDKYRKTLDDASLKLIHKKTHQEDADVDVGPVVALIGLERGIDTLIWQLIASVAAPGYTIHTVVSLVSGLLSTTIMHSQAAGNIFDALAAGAHISNAVVIETVQKSIPTGAGLFAIPFIVHPIDSGVHAVLNSSLRPIMRRVICENGGKELGIGICQPK